MKTKVIIELQVRDFKRLADYLSAHEYDIAEKMDDFDELHGLYMAVYEDEPKGE